MSLANGVTSRLLTGDSVPASVSSGSASKPQNNKITNVSLQQIFLYLFDPRFSACPRAVKLTCKSWNAAVTNLPIKQILDIYLNQITDALTGSHTALRGKEAKRKAEALFYDTIAFDHCVMKTWVGTRNNKQNPYSFLSDNTGHEFGIFLAGSICPISKTEFLAAQRINGISFGRYSIKLTDGEASIEKREGSGFHFLPESGSFLSLGKQIQCVGHQVLFRCVTQDSTAFYATKNMVINGQRHSIACLDLSQPKPDPRECLQLAGGTLDGTIAMQGNRLYRIVNMAVQALQFVDGAYKEVWSRNNAKAWQIESNGPWLACYCSIGDSYENLSILNAEDGALQLNVDNLADIRGFTFLRGPFQSSIFGNFRTGRAWHIPSRREFTFTPFDLPNIDFRNPDADSLCFTNDLQPIFFTRLSAQMDNESTYYTVTPSKALAKPAAEEDQD
jgi:hypothetical protein